MVGADGQLPLPWLAAPLRDALQTRHGHALLVHGPEGVGQFELSLTLAQAWLCESPQANKPCGTCASCRLVQSHGHPDLLVLMPEALRETLGWAGGDEDGAAADKASKAKPSKEIKVDAVRSAVAFAQTTSARGRGKVVVIHPAERMNGIAANALLKTLEEPAGAARFLLSCSAPQALLPTIRSRCQALPLALPDTAQACAWLESQQLARPEVLLAAAGGQPQQALAWAGQGIDAALWTALPRQIARGDVGGLAAWPLPRLVDMLQKLCHDAMRLTAGAAPRYFPAGSLPEGADFAALAHWLRALQRVARHADHPWGAALLAESLVQQARDALGARPSVAYSTPPARGASVHSGA